MTDTTTQWRGLHNPERHDEMPLGIYGCWHCARNGDPHEDCTPDWPCYCCLAAEVEVLRAQVQRVREVKPREKAVYRDEGEWDDGWNACLDTVLAVLDGDTDA
ncbi:MAG: hypothetical protein IPK64_21075 [bacterium]|nr:hypothetical protein [bacterium]